MDSPKLRKYSQLSYFSFNLVGNLGVESLKESNFSFHFISLREKYESQEIILSKNKWKLLKKP